MPFAIAQWSRRGGGVALRKSEEELDYAGLERKKSFLFRTERKIALESEARCSSYTWFLKDRGSNNVGVVGCAKVAIKSKRNGMRGSMVHRRQIMRLGRSNIRWK